MYPNKIILPHDVPMKTAVFIKIKLAFFRGAKKDLSIRKVHINNDIKVGINAINETTKKNNRRGRIEEKDIASAILIINSKTASK